MKAFVAVLASAAAASAGVVPAAAIPAPAFPRVTPKIASRTVAVGETTHVHTPAAIKTIQPGAITTTHHVARPVLAQQPIYRQEPVIGPVATHTTVEQPLYKTRTITHTGVQTHTAVHAQPAIATVGYAAAPAVATGVVAGAPAALAGGVVAAPAGAIAGGAVYDAGLGYGLGLAAPAGIIADGAAIVAEH